MYGYVMSTDSSSFRLVSQQDNFLFVCVKNKNINKGYIVHLQFDLHYQKVTVFALECRIID